MSRRLHRLWLLPLLLLASEGWALGLGDIRVSSALNQPLRAEIQLLATTPEELNNLTVQLASSATFARYDLDRPAYLTRLRFQVIRSGGADGNIIRVTSVNPVREPFITFLVEAAWSRGKLLREYTLLLDPPTFAAPPATQSSQEVRAPTRATPSDSGRIQRPAQQQPAATPPAPPRPAVQAPVRTAPVEPAQSPSPIAIGAEPTPTPVPALEPGLATFATTSGGDIVVQRGDTLWGISRRVRPDSRLTMNQTMLAIYEANPDAFAGNINRLRAGAVLRIPSADDVFSITRTDAFAEVQRQNETWGGLPDHRASALTSAPVLAPPVELQPNLTLVPPDDDVSLADTSATSGTPETVIDASPVDPDEARIQELEALFADQESLLAIEDNELAALRAELAALRGEELPRVAATLDDAAAELLAADDEGLQPDAVQPNGADAADDSRVSAPPVVAAPVRDEPGMVAVIMGYLSNFWVIIGAALAVAIALLAWFLRRAAKDDEEEGAGVWDAIDAADEEREAHVVTQSMNAPAKLDESMILVEEARAPRPAETPVRDTLEVPALVEPDDPLAAESLADASMQTSLEDTFSSETAINLDQTDPMAEADFHMAYGLYDQAADLINGVLETEPGRADLLAKLCEIYFVWGNRDEFIDAAGLMKVALDGEPSADWDKIVIMGQQIAADDEMFSGVSAGVSASAVDLAFDDAADEIGELDMNLAEDSLEDAVEVIDLGAATGELPAADDDEISGDGIDQERVADVGNDLDFSFPEPELETSDTLEMPEAESGAAASNDTAGTLIIEEMPADDAADSDADDPTVESPTIEQQFETLVEADELPETDVPGESVSDTDATAEINLDDLGLDLDSLSDPSLSEPFSDDDQASISQDLATTGEFMATGTDIADELEITGEIPSLEASQSGIHEGLDIDSSGPQDALPDLNEPGDTDAASLLDATGLTQVLSEDMMIESGVDPDAVLSDDDQTMLAPGPSADSSEDQGADDVTLLDDEEEDGFDFPKTESLPNDAFTADLALDDTGKMPSFAGSTDRDLDLDNLTAAIDLNEVGDTVEQPQDDATIEHSRIKLDEVDLDVGKMVDDDSADETIQALMPDDLSDDLHEARTMTEVGTKLDLARAYVDMGDPSGARSILEEVLDEGDAAQRQQAQNLLGSLPG